MVSRDMSWVLAAGVAVCAAAGVAYHDDTSRVAVADGLVERLLPGEVYTRGPSVSAPFLPVPRAEGLDPTKVALGRRLFHDTRLSGDGRVSCASCHDLSHGGDDGRPVSVGVDGRRGEFNAPSVFNAALNPRQLRDGRARDLYEQVALPLLAEHEMDVDWDRALDELRGDDALRPLFETAYGGVVSPATVQDAIVTFEFDLTTPDAPFDHHLRGDAEALGARARRGFELFLEFGCVACHQGVNVGGNMFQTLGQHVPYYDADIPFDSPHAGRARITGRRDDLHRFRVPSLRNVALTAPYLHDGSIPTLDEAVHLMGRHEVGFELGDDEVGALVAFLEALTGQHESW